MKKMIASLVALTLITPLVASAHPGYGGPDHGWHGDAPHERHGGPGIRFLPGAATAVLIGGLTYYLLNGNYYQRQGERYVVVQPPPVTSSSAMIPLDYSGERYYVQDGHYYKRHISGEFVEVPRPPGL